MYVLVLYFSSAECIFTVVVMTSILVLIATQQWKISEQQQDFSRFFFVGFAFFVYQKSFVAKPYFGKKQISDAFGLGISSKKRSYVYYKEVARVGVYGLLFLSTGSGSSCHMMCALYT